MLPKIGMCLIGLSFVVLLVNIQPITGDFDDLCLECLCNITSGCKVEKSKECFNGVCGIFRITKPYWVDAGQLTVDGNDADQNRAYETCVTDINCSANTVKAYMTKFEQDCDNNGVIDCYDYGSIHILGGYGCTGQLPAPQRNGIAGCLSYSRRR